VFLDFLPIAFVRLSGKFSCRLGPVRRCLSSSTTIGENKKLPIYTQKIPTLSFMPRPYLAVSVISQKP